MCAYVYVCMAHLIKEKNNATKKILMVLDENWLLLLSHHKQGTGFPDGSAGKDSACNAGGLGLIPGLGRSSGEGNGYLLQYSCLGNPMDREAWWATVHRVINESDTTKHRPYFSKN